MTIGNKGIEYVIIYAIRWIAHSDKDITFSLFFISTYYRALVGLIVITKPTLSLGLGHSRARLLTFLRARNPSLLNILYTT